jgi:LmbE family N-acetylglucosaminyl deacetylase
MMRADAAWRALRALPVQDFDEAFGESSLVVLAPHPDDESLGCGGLIAEACARGRPPWVVVLTDGSASHPGSIAYPPERLRRVREAEATRAVRALGLESDRLLFLRHPDSLAPTTGPRFADAVAVVAELIREAGCSTVVVSWRHDPHCDHVAAAGIAAASSGQTGARLLAYPIWGWTLPDGQLIDQAPISGFRLDVRAHIQRKRRAIEAHASQHGRLVPDDPDGFRLPPEFVERFLVGTETFIDMEPGP